MPGLIEFTITNFRGIVKLHAEPNGKSVTLKGKNGSGKSSAIDALWWAVGGQIDGSIITNDAERAEVNVTFNGYKITRTQTRGKPAKLAVKSEDGKATFNSPTALLSGFVASIERQTFTHKNAKEQAAILRKLCPEIDTASLDAEYAKTFAERTGVNRDAKQLDAQANGIAVPDSPTSVPDAIDVAAIAEKKSEVERQRAANAETMRHHREQEKTVEICQSDVSRLEKELQSARYELVHARSRLDESAKLIANIKPIDTTAIDDEIRLAKSVNADRETKLRAIEKAKFLSDQKETLRKQAEDKNAESERLTKRLSEITQTKSNQLAVANLPIDGLAINGETVTLDSESGPVEIVALNTAAKIRLDVAIAAALGLRLIAVRDASLLDADEMARLDEFANARQVQLLKEVVATGQLLTAEIEEAD